MLLHSAMLNVLLTTLSKDFDFDVKSVVDAVLYIVQLRETESKALKAQKVQELKNTASFRGLSFKKNMKKQPLLEFLVVEHCNFSDYDTLMP